MSCFTHVVGTGGLGSGCIFRLEQNHDLARNESRPAYRLPGRDACKQQIILHYIARMLKRREAEPHILAIGAVGNDLSGRNVIQEMNDACIDTAGVRVDEEHATLYSVCWQFPDGAGGNLTECRSASNTVTPTEIAHHAEPVLGKHGKSALVIAAPEVPLDARKTLLQMGRLQGALTAASFVRAELLDHRCQEILHLVDVVGVNRDEAAALANCSADLSGALLLENIVRVLEPHSQNRIIWMTLGGEGAWVWHRGTAEKVPAYGVPAVNTAGAGDASFAGLLSGIALGCPILSSATSAGRMASLFGAYSIVSPDTLRYDFTRDSLRAFIKDHNLQEWRTLP